MVVSFSSIHSLQHEKGHVACWVSTRVRVARSPPAGRVDGHNRKASLMGLDDKIENKAEDLKGKAKEATGKATDDGDLEAEGKTDQTKSSLKDAKENVKDAFS